MIAIGETLRHERLKKNLDLNEISRELKIAPRFLEAIEDEQFDRLPGTVFAKAFVLQYARLLGVGEGQLAGEVQQRFEPVMQTPQLTEALAPAAAPIHVPPVEAWESGGEHKFTWPSWIPAAGLVIVAMLGCSFVYAWWQKDRRTVSAQTPAAAPQTAQAATAPTVPLPGTPDTQAPAADALPAPAPANPVQPNPAPPAAAPTQTPATPADASTATPSTTAAATAPAETAPADANAPDPNASVHVAVTAEEPAWISARSDGKNLFSGTLETNETRTLEGNGTVTVRIGNAGGVDITLNGRKIGPIGSKGQTRTIQFTSGGFQIVAAPKPSLPAPAPI
jgi:cytoskeleton protein RodZ